MSGNLSILFVEDVSADVELVLHELKRAGFVVESERVETAREMTEALKRKAWDLVIADCALPSFGAGEAIEIIHHSDMDIPLIVLSGTIGEEAAVTLLKAGAHDFVRKDNLSRLVPAIQREMREAKVRRERREAHELLLHRASHDSLTGIWNRSYFLEHLHRAISYSRRRADYLFAVLFLDLDRFKVINDSLGHETGDQLLILVAQRLESSLRPGDYLARFGGDEFTIFLHDLKHENDAALAASRILKDLARPFQVSGHELYTSASIGIAISHTGYESTEDMVRDADTAMYRSKCSGTGRYAIFDLEMHARAVLLQKLELDLRHAIERSEFLLHYQPIVSLGNGHVVGFEALVRWQHPERGLLLPDEFIRVAEETGLIHPLGKWVLSSACKWMREWQVELSAVRRLSLSVNMSCRQFEQSNIVEEIKSVLTTTGLDPRCLKLEITEGTMMQDAENVNSVLVQLRDLDVQLHVDDFGIGYSSLSYLHRLPIDTLKIDKSFTATVIDNPETVEVVRAIIGIAKSLNMDVVAEGIESQEQLHLLRSLGCKYGQGYLFSQPVDRSEARSFLFQTPSVGALLGRDMSGR